MANFHPSASILKAYCDGTLMSSSALIVSAHLDMCPTCRKQANALMDANAEKEFDMTTPAMSDDLLKMMSKISDQPQIRVSEEFVNSKQTLKLEGKEFKVPRTLVRYLNRVDEWKRLVGNLWQASVGVETDENISFLYMSAGGKVPEHTHKGSEYSLVIDGSFADEAGEYKNGDFLFCDGSKQHTPYTDDPDGCLIFTVVDQPLHFTSGLARLINPFSHLFFR